MFDAQFAQTACHFTLPDSSRRQCARLRCDHALLGSAHLPQVEEPLEIWIRDLSPEGIGITTSVPVEIGQEILIKLRRSKSVAANLFPAQVVYCFAESDCCWCIGCLFKEPLDPMLLQYLAG